MKNKSSWAGVVGLPDSKDKENIRDLIKAYESVHPGQIRRLVAEEKAEEAENAGPLGLNKYLLKNQQSDFRKVLIIPAPLVAELKKSYPTLFSDKAHFAWFVKNFPIFMVPERY